MTRAQQRQRAPDQIVLARAQFLGKLTVEDQRIAVRHFRDQRIPCVDKGEQCLDGVIAVGTAGADMQRQIDLRPAGFAHFRHHGAIVAGVNPSRSFASSRVAMSASAISAAARQT